MTRNYCWLCGVIQHLVVSMTSGVFANVKFSAKIENKWIGGNDGLESWKMGVKISWLFPFMYSNSIHFIVVSVFFVRNRLFIYFSDKIYHRNCYTAVLCFRLIWGYFVTQTIVVNFLNQHKIVDFFSLHIVYSTISRKRKCSP